MQLANAAHTTLVSSITDFGTTLVLDDESLFPTVTATILTGTVTSTAGNAYSITGSGTLFTTQLAVGDMVTWTGIEHRRVVRIVSDTVAILDRTASVSGVTLTKRNAYYLTLASGGDLAHEYVLVMSTSGDTFTVARGQDGSIGQAFAAGSTVEYRVTAGFVTQVIEQAVANVMQNLIETHGADLIGLEAAGVVASTVRTAFVEVAAAVAAHLVDTTAAHAASAISFTPASGIAATTVQAAIVEAISDLTALISGHTGLGTAAHAATSTSFSPYGGITAVNVQTAIQAMWDALAPYSGGADKIQDAITTSGQTFSDVDDNQLSKAMAVYAAGSDYWTCAGSGGAFTLASPTSPAMRKPPAYFSGMRVRFLANAVNTAGVTVDVGGLGAKSVYTNGGVALPANAWIPNLPVELVYNGTAFRMATELPKEYIVRTASARVTHTQPNNAAPGSSGELSITAYTPLSAWSTSSFQFLVYANAVNLGSAASNVSRADILAGTNGWELYNRDASYDYLRANPLSITNGTPTPFIRLSLGKVIPASAAIGTVFNHTTNPIRQDLQLAGANWTCTMYFETDDISPAYLEYIVVERVIVGELYPHTWRNDKDWMA